MGWGLIPGVIKHAEKGPWNFLTPRGLLSKEQFHWDDNTGCIITLKGEEPTEKAKHTAFKWFNLDTNEHCFPFNEIKYDINIYGDVYKLWYYYGYLIKTIFFDTNVLIEVIKPWTGWYRKHSWLNAVFIDYRTKETKHQIQSRLAYELQENYNVTVVGDMGYLNVTQKETKR